MGEMITFTPTEAQFGVLWKYLMQPNVTDVDFNGKELWITDLKTGRYRAKEQLSEQFISAFTHNISNCVNKQFNNANKILEADTKELRISVIHDSVATSGISICIRKSPCIVRSSIRRTAQGGILPGTHSASAHELRSGGNEFCVRRRAGREDECAKFSCSHSKGGAGHHDRGFA